MSATPAPAPSSGDNDRLLAAARAWAAANYSGIPVVEVVLRLATGQRVRLPVTCLPAPVPLPAGAETSASVPPLRRVHRKILEVATRQPIPAKQLSSKAGYHACNSYFRSALTDLVRLELLRHTPDGYQLPG